MHLGRNEVAVIHLTNEAPTPSKVALLAVPTSAQGGSAPPGPADCTPEVEPNDVPEGAPELTGPVCQQGDLPETDPQDLAIWTVSDADASQLWTFT